MGALRSLAILAIASTAACADAPAAGECDKLVEHLVDMQLTEAGVSEADIADNRAKLLEEVRPALLPRCEKDIRGGQLRCSLKAKTRAELDKCDKV